MGLEEWEIKEEIIRKKIFAFEDRGFMFLQEWQMGFYVPNRIKTPSGRIFEESELLNFFKKNRPEFGNPEHLEIRDALEYLELIDSELFPDRFGYCSFLDEEDEKKARKKYS